MEKYLQYRVTSDEKTVMMSLLITKNIEKEIEGKLSTSLPKDPLPGMICFKGYEFDIRIGYKLYDGIGLGKDMVRLLYIFL
jgi:hypothetical protein